MGRVAALIGEGGGVATVAAQVGFSVRQLNRRSLASFGYGPKVLGRVLRLQRVLSAARFGMPLVEAALAAGYADQAHFAHERERRTEFVPGPTRPSRWLKEQRSCHNRKALVGARPVGIGHVGPFCVRQPCRAVDDHSVDVVR